MYNKGGVFYERAEEYPPAKFVLLPKENKVKSNKEGRPIFEDKAYIQVLKEGGSILTFEANDQYKGRYPKEWDAFEQQQEVAQEGTALEHWPGCTRAQCENLKSLNVFTVEQLSDASEIVLEKLMGARTLKMQAVAYLENSQDSGKLAKRISKLEEDNKYLKQRNKELLDGKINKKKEGK